MTESRDRSPAPSDTPGDWPEDSQHENGQYQCACIECGALFIGHKRRVVCKACSLRSAERSEIDPKALSAWRAARGVAEMIESAAPQAPAPSDTPRTDALQQEYRDKHVHPGVAIAKPEDPMDIWDFARQLKRELAEARDLLLRSYALLWDGDCGPDGVDVATEIAAKLRLPHAAITHSAERCPENNEPCLFECSGGWCRTLFGHTDRELDALKNAAPQEVVTGGITTPTPGPHCAELATDVESGGPAVAAPYIDRDDDARFEWLSNYVFERKWDGTIGRKPSWQMAGPYRHELMKMKGDTLREAIDNARSALKSPAPEEATPYSVSDGFGNTWSCMRGRNTTCGLQVVRPGKAQCDVCDT